MVKHAEEMSRKVTNYQDFPNKDSSNSNGNKENFSSVLPKHVVDLEMTSNPLHFEKYGPH